ncbi:MAG: hypothetical protein ACM3O7_08085 [Acidobacteriota bacterium]
MTRRLLPVLIMTALVATTAAGGDIAFDAAFTATDFARLADALADTISFPVAGPASPSGVLGLRVLAGTGGPNVDTGSHWWQHGVNGDTVAGALIGSRVVVRAGLPFRLDAGGQVGQVLGERFWGLEGRWALLAGGVLEPAVGVRASYSRLDGGPVGLEVGELQLALSKGFAVVTPYAALGLRRTQADASFGDPAPRRREHSSQIATASLGAQVSLALFKVLAEVRKGRSVGYFVALGFGL